MLLLMATEHITQHPEEIGVYGMLLAIGYYAAKHFWGKRKYESKLKSVEAKIESDHEAGEESSIAHLGGKNPGRTTVELVEIVYEDLKEFRKETREQLTKHTQQIGEIRGRLGIKED